MKKYHRVICFLVLSVSTIRLVGSEDVVRQLYSEVLEYYCEMIREHPELFRGSWLQCESGDEVWGSVDCEQIEFDEQRRIYVFGDRYYLPYVIYFQRGDQIRRWVYTPGLVGPLIPTRLMEYMNWMLKGLDKQRLLGRQDRIMAVIGYLVYCESERVEILTDRVPGTGWEPLDSGEIQQLVEYGISKQVIRHFLEDYDRLQYVWIDYVRRGVWGVSIRIRDEGTVEVRESLLYRSERTQIRM